MAGKAAPGEGGALARAVLDDGRALARFVAICEAQGGLRIPPRASHRFELTAHVAGRIMAIDTRGVARVAKLAGAPRDPAAGACLHARVGQCVELGQPLLTLHASSQGELQYAASDLRAQLPLVRIEALP
jgi:thymidine phosphorylase